MFHNILMTVCDSFAIIFLVLSINEYRKARAIALETEAVLDEIINASKRDEN